MSDNGGEGSSAPEVHTTPVEASASLATTASGACGAAELECNKVEDGANACGEVAVPGITVEEEVVKTKEVKTKKHRFVSSLKKMAHKKKAPTVEATAAGENVDTLQVEPREKKHHGLLNSFNKKVHSLKMPSMHSKKAPASAGLPEEVEENVELEKGELDEMSGEVEILPVLATKDRPHAPAGRKSRSVEKEVALVQGTPEVDMAPVKVASEEVTTEVKTKVEEIAPVKVVSKEVIPEVKTKVEDITYVKVVSEEIIPEVETKVEDITPVKVVSKEIITEVDTKVEDITSLKVIPNEVTTEVTTDVEAKKEDIVEKVTVEVPAKKSSVESRLDNLASAVSVSSPATPEFVDNETKVTVEDTISKPDSVVEPILKGELSALATEGDSASATFELV